MDLDKETCKNCEKQFNEGYKFCPNCGQKTADDLTLGVLFYNTISNYFSFDARFLKSFFPLMFKPGYLGRKFIEGKRLLYLHPAQMYLFVSVIFFFLSSFTVSNWQKQAQLINEKIVNKPEDFIGEKALKQLDSLKKEEIINEIKEAEKELGLTNVDKAKAEDSLKLKTNDKIENINWGNINKKKLDSLIAAGAEDEVIYKEMGMPRDANYIQRALYKCFLNIAKGSGFGNIIRRAFDAIPIAMFFLLPVFALILKLFYFRKGRFSYHLVFSFYYFSFLFALFSVLMLISRYVIEIPAWLTTLIVLSTFFYFYLSLINFYRSHWLSSFIKSIFITVIFMLIIIPITVAALGFFGLINA